MPVCEICGMKVVEVYPCFKCEAEFCKECGVVNSKCCYDCHEWRAWYDYSERESEGLGEGWDRSYEEREPH